jgi:UDP-GlcNAc:undecaprenyl-phosphate/decaprenyl-phosphate GlcNAc-1-phosphate transferase
VALFIVPIYDTARIFIKRARKGRSPLAPDKSHVHHFLLRIGFSHDKIALIFGAVNLIFIALVIIGRPFNDHIMLPIVLLMAIGMGIALDRFTIRSIIRNHKKAPAILANRLKKEVYKKPELSKGILDRNEFNVN